MPRWRRAGRAAGRSSRVSTRRSKRASLWVRNPSSPCQSRATPCSTLDRRFPCTLHARSSRHHESARCAEDCQIESLNCEPAEDATYLAKVAACASGGAQPVASWGAADVAAIKSSKLQLREENVAKVVKDGVTYLSFMPTASACVLAVGDKKGHVRTSYCFLILHFARTGSIAVASLTLHCLHGAFLGCPMPLADMLHIVRRAATSTPRREQKRSSNTGAHSLIYDTLRVQLGLWVHDPASVSEELDALGQDGVLLTALHRQYISGLHWLPDGSTSCRLVTSSYDGSVLLFDAAAERVRVLRDDDSDELSCLGCKDSSTLLTGDNLVRNHTPAITALRAAALCAAGRQLEARDPSISGSCPDGGFLLVADVLKAVSVEAVSVETASGCPYDIVLIVQDQCRMQGNISVLDLRMDSSSASTDVRSSLNVHNRKVNSIGARLQHAGALFQHTLR